MEGIHPHTFDRLRTGPTLSLKEREQPCRRGKERPSLPPRGAGVRPGTAKRQHRTRISQLVYNRGWMLTLI